MSAIGTTDEGVKDRIDPITGVKTGEYTISEGYWDDASRESRILRGLFLSSTTFLFFIMILWGALERNFITSAWHSSALVILLYAILTTKRPDSLPTQSTILDEISHFESSVTGIKHDTWFDEAQGRKITSYVSAACALFAIYSFTESQYMAIRNGASDFNSWIYAAVVALASTLLLWLSLIVAIKEPKFHRLIANPSEYARGFESSLRIFLISLLAGFLLSGPITGLALAIFVVALSRISNVSLTGLISAWLILQFSEWLAYFVLVEADWEIIWSNRVLILVGQLMTESMTQDYFPYQNWRIWLLVYFAWPIVGGLYGTMASDMRNFILPFSAISFILALIAWNPEVIIYDSSGTLKRLGFASLLAIGAFILSNWYSVRSGEFLANRLRSSLLLSIVVLFFLTFIIMDPPESLRKASCKEILYPFVSRPIFDESGLYNIGTSHFYDTAGSWECGTAHFAGTPILGDYASGMATQGIKPSQWGGLFVNIILASAGCVLGFGLGIILAFGRQSDLGIFKVPSVLFIEIFRSGPLVCWIYFAFFLLPNVFHPLFDDPETFDVIVRMITVFALFGGVYIAEIIRGGLQAVDSGQREAAIALGLNPIQAKLQVELPFAIRTTLPSIVNAFIGLWKDTTLLFILGVMDFFFIGRIITGSDIRYMNSILEPIYLSAFIFWLGAFYLSRISLRIEGNLGLLNKDGGEAA